jgi:hypothetical protein
MRMNKNMIFAFILVFSLLLVISSAFMITDTNYKIKGVIGIGGKVTGGFITKTSVGQSIAGAASNANNIVCFGFFCSFIPTGVNTINFTGYLNYSSGEPVKNSLIVVTIRNQTLGFERKGMSQTDNVGYFFIKLENLPKMIMSSNFDVSMRVLGNVEAVYDCWYNHTSENCCSLPFTPPC